MGIPVNLLDAWEPYKAACTALNNTLAQHPAAGQHVHAVDTCAEQAGQSASYPECGGHVVYSFNGGAC